MDWINNNIKYFIFCVRYKYDDFNGRARRKEFWMFMLVFYILGWLIYAINEYVYWIYLFLVSCPGMAVSARRLHDIGKSGLWLLVAVAAHAVAALFSLPGLRALALGIDLCFVILLARDSQPGTNKWGPNPKIADVAAAGQQGEELEDLERYRKAAEEGNAEAQCILGWRCEHGVGASKDISQALEWYRQAAAQGNKCAQNALDRLTGYCA